MKINKKFILLILFSSVLIIACVIFVNYNRKQNVAMEGESETARRMWYYGTKDNVIDKSIESIINNKEYHEGGQYIGFDKCEDYSDKDVPLVLNYDNINYYCRSNFIEEKYVGTLICEDEANDVSIYEIQNVSTELAIAVKGENKYYPYMNDEYNTSSMEQFFEDIGGYKSIIAPEVRMVVRDDSIESLVYYDGYLEYLKTEIIELAKNVKCIELGKAEYTGLHLRLYLEHIKARIEIDFYENGDVHIKCNGVLNSWRFNTGEKGIEFATKLIEYLVENCKGKYY